MIIEHNYFVENAECLSLHWRLSDKFAAKIFTTSQIHHLYQKARKQTLSREEIETASSQPTYYSNMFPIHLFQ